MKQIEIFGYRVTIERVVKPSVGTLPTGKRARRRLAREASACATKCTHGDTKIQRIKTVRDLRGGGLRQAKAWVELAFDDNGCGSIKE